MADGAPVLPVGGKGDSRAAHGQENVVSWTARSQVWIERVFGGGLGGAVHSHSTVSQVNSRASPEIIEIFRLALTLGHHPTCGPRWPRVARDGVVGVRVVHVC
jgi:hypothetical protein